MIFFSDFQRKALESISLTLVLLVFLFIAVHVCLYPILDHWVLYGFCALLIFIQLTLFFEACLISSTTYLLVSFDKERKADEVESKYAVLLVLLRGMLWILMVLLFLENVGVDVKTLLAGLGIGGLAIALAVKNTLEDLMSSVSILIDKPFETGDAVLVGDIRGTVEKIGIKSTRIRSISGEQVIISNTNMVRTRVHNFKQMDYRRSLFTLNIDFFTPPELLKKIPGILGDIINSIDISRFDRAHFSYIGQSCLKIEVVYFVNSREYVMLMDIQQQINLSLLEELKKIGVNLAYPRNKTWFYDR